MESQEPEPCVLPRLSEQLNLDGLWDTLGFCLTELSRTSDHHAVLVLQPAVEAFFIVHAGTFSPRNSPNQLNDSLIFKLQTVIATKRSRDEKYTDLFGKSVKTILSTDVTYSALYLTQYYKIVEIIFFVSHLQEKRTTKRRQICSQQRGKIN